MLKVRQRPRSEGKQKRSSFAEKVDFLDLCENSARNIQDLVQRGHLLNPRQCQDLSVKISITIKNIQNLYSHCGVPVEDFGPALKNLYRYVLRAEALVRSCAEKKWCAAAVFQCQNENAFGEILLDVSLCYSAIYEHNKSALRYSWTNPPEDLRESSILDPASGVAVDEDNEDLKRRLADHAKGHTDSKRFDILNERSGVQTRFLANYLVTKMCHKPLEPHASTLDVYDPLLWPKGLEPRWTWGSSRILGVGSPGVSVCRTKWLGIPCAKKEFLEEGSDAIFMKEAGIMAHLKHPCIVNFICCGNGSKKGDCFIAMELMEKSLFDLIKEQKGVHFAPDVAIDIIVQMARGMWYLHEQGVAHRDLKPQNVVVKRLALPHLEDYFCVKLVDFGISKMKVETSQLNTMTAQGIGTTRYRAPEANPGERGKVDWFKADAFGFAMTCAHLLSLEIPFQEITSHSELYKEVSTNARRPKLPDQYPDALLTLLKDCWKSNPGSRPSFKRICTKLETLKYEDASVDGDKGCLSMDYIMKKMGEKLSEVEAFDVSNGRVASIAAALNIIQSVKDAAENVCVNKAECKRLAERFGVIGKALEGSKMEEYDDTFLKQIVAVLEDGKSLVKSYEGEQNAIENVLYRVQNSAPFKEVREEIDGLGRYLNFDHADMKGELKTSAMEKNMLLDSDAKIDQEEILSNVQRAIPEGSGSSVGRADGDVRSMKKAVTDKCFNAELDAEDLSYLDPFESEIVLEGGIKELTPLIERMSKLDAHFDGPALVNRCTWDAVKFDASHSNTEGSRKEIASLAKLRHPHVTQLIGKTNVLNEMMDSDLRRLIEFHKLMKTALSNSLQNSRPFSRASEFSIILQIASGMEYLHSMQIAHGDLKCSNILVKRVGEDMIDVKVADLHTASRYLGNAPATMFKRARWMSPEDFQYRNRVAHSDLEHPTDELLMKADVYSFAMTCYEVVTGKYPFDDVRDARRIEQMVKQRIRPILPADFCGDLKTLIVKCWHQDPDERPSFQDICYVLNVLARGAPSEDDFRIDGDYCQRTCDLMTFKKLALSGGGPLHLEVGPLVDESPQMNAAP